MSLPPHSSFFSHNDSRRHDSHSFRNTLSKAMRVLPRKAGAESGSLWFQSKQIFMTSSYQLYMCRPAQTHNTPKASVPLAPYIPAQNDQNFSNKNQGKNNTSRWDMVANACILKAILPLGLNIAKEMSPRPLVHTTGSSAMQNLGMSQKPELELLETSPIFKILVFQLKPRPASK